MYTSAIPQMSKQGLKGARQRLNDMIQGIQPNMMEMQQPPDIMQPIQQPSDMMQPIQEPSDMMQPIQEPS
ncbi:3256_t:CDS:1, partial [Acaulospora morrowiae]